ncbi:MAG: LysE family transporter [Candidatus Dormiibacterota bacterium]
MSSLLVRGFVLGFAVAASPGPIFFLCLRRTLVRGRLYGLVSGLGVATADGFYAVVGGSVLVVLGARIFLERQKPAIEAPAVGGAGLAWAYLSTLGLTITNPATIISFAALAATLGLGGGGTGLVKPVVVVGGVLVGSATWWCVLAFAASILRARVTPGVVRGISMFSGLAIVLLGMLAIYSAFSLT